MDEEYNVFEITAFEYDILKVYIKHGYGTVPLKDTTFFNPTGYIFEELNSYTVQEYYDNAIDADGNLWKEKK